MVKRLLFILLLFGFKANFAQTTNDFSSSLLTLAKQVASSIQDTTIVKLAVWDFTDLNGATTQLGKYISEETQINFLNTGKNYEIMDRNHLNEILKEHKLNTDGFIDEKTAKELGKLQAVDAIVTGTVTVLDGKIKVSMKILNTETASTIAGKSAEFLMNEDIKLLLGMTSYDNSGQKVNSDPKLTPGANEVYNDDKMVTKDCQTRNVGDYCFYNTTKFNMYIVFRKDSNNEYTYTEVVKAGESACFYSVEPSRYIYTLRYNPTDPNADNKSTISGTSNSKEYKQGSVFVELCKSKTFTIK